MTRRAPPAHCMRAPLGNPLPLALSLFAVASACGKEEVKGSVAAPAMPTPPTPAATLAELPGAPHRTDPCRRVDANEYYLVEDFELGIGRSWWVSGDGTGTWGELPGREPAAAEIPGGRCGVSRYALRLTAAGLERFGGAFGRNFYPEPFDASGWDGLSFWAKRGKETVNRRLFVSVGEPHTDQSNGVRLRGASFCEEAPEAPERKCDRFGATVNLETEWRFFTIPFEAMRQRGFGRKAPRLDRRAVIGINIEIGTGDWDLWIDDMAFFREKR